MFSHTVVAHFPFTLRKLNHTNSLQSSGYNESLVPKMGVCFKVMYSQENNHLKLSNEQLYFYNVYINKITTKASYWLELILTFQSTFNTI